MFFSVIFLIIDLNLSITALIPQIYNLTTELAIPMGMPANEKKAETETHPGIAEVYVLYIAQYNLQPYKLFCASYLLNYFVLFHLWNNFLFLFFDIIILADKSFSKTLRRFEACLLVSNSWIGKLDSSFGLPIIFDNNLKITPVSHFLAYFNLSSGEFDNFTFTLWYWDILY